jgi:hypothetical protein
MNDNKTLFLEGTAHWAHIRKPNELSGKYQLDLSIDKKTETQLKAEGITIKNKGDDRGNFVTLTKSAMTKDGTELKGPLVIDAQKNALPEGTLIGNGSKVVVKSSPYEWSFKGKKGKSLGLTAIQVVDLVEYKSSITEGFSSVDGYTVNDATDESSPF